MRLAARDHIVEHAGIGPFIPRPARDPHVELVIAPHKTIHMDAGGANPEKRAGRPFNLHQRRIVAVQCDRIEFIPRRRQYALRKQCRYDPGDCRRAAVEIVESGRKRDRGLRNDENLGKGRQMGDVVLSHPAGAHVRNLKGSECRRVEIIAGFDVVKVAHESAESFIAPASDDQAAPTSTASTR